MPSCVAPAVPAGSCVVDPQPFWFCFGTLVPTSEGQRGRGVYSTDVAFATPRLEALELDGCEVSERDFSPDFVSASEGEMATELLLFPSFLACSLWHLWLVAVQHR